jgi:serine/threonine protein kinase
MTTNEDEPGLARSEEPGSPERVEDVAAFYADRFTAGEKLDTEEILAAHSTAGRDVLDQLVLFVDLDVTDHLLGTLGDYTLRRQIGRGGMGVVYEAEERSMERSVALEVLPAGVAADDRAFHRGAVSRGSKRYHSRGHRGTTQKELRANLLARSSF